MSGIYVLCPCVHRRMTSAIDWFGLGIMYKVECGESEAVSPRRGCCSVGSVLGAELGPHRVAIVHAVHVSCSKGASIGAPFNSISPTYRSSVYPVQASKRPVLTMAYILSQFARAISDFRNFYASIFEPSLSAPCDVLWLLMQRFHHFFCG